MNNRIIFNKKNIEDILGEEHSSLCSVVSDKFGIVNAVMERFELEEYGLKMFQCLSADTRKLFGLSRDASSGGLGISETRQGALISCIAEAIERYCMSYIPSNEVFKNYLININKENVVTNFNLYTDEQYEKYDNFINPMKDDTYWTKLNGVSKKDFIYWPASLVYLPFEIDKPVAELTSTGMAAGTSINMAIQSGLLELIERDSLMINFKQRLNPPEIDLESIENKKLEKLIEQIKKNYNIKTYKLYTDLKIPTYLSYIWNKDGKNIHYGIGAATNLNSDEAIYKSLKECLFTNFYSKNIMDLKKDNKEEINTLYEHFLYYQGENFKDLLFKSNKIKYKKIVLTFDEVLEDLQANRNICVLQGINDK